jgi:hypothetical protein
MFKNKITIVTSFLFAAAVFLICGCQKVEKGFISDNIYYAENPFTVMQGITAVSTGLVIDGSTTPVNAKLLAVRDIATGADASKYFLKPDTIRVYTGAISYSDSTVALLNLKLKDSTLAPFSINTIGGRLQFTQATKFIPQGKYMIDVQASNIRGTRVLKNACQINVTASVADTLFTLAYNHSNSTFTDFVGEPATLLNFKITHDPSGPSKIVYVWKDKNGNNFNPANGEVNGRPNRPAFVDWDPYYPQVKTDTSIEFGYPKGVPQFPIFQNPQNYTWATNGLCYYSVSGSHTDIGMNANTTFGILYYATQGTYVITIMLTDITRVP